MKRRPRGALDQRLLFGTAAVAFTVVMLALPVVITTPLQPEEDVRSLLDAMEDHLVAEAWTGAETTAAALQKGWRRVRRRLFLNSSPADIRQFEDSLSQLLVAVAEQDRLEARLHVASLKQTWTSLGSY